MTEKPPTRFTEEGISLPERGSGLSGAPVGVIPGEPEKLTIPAEAVALLIRIALLSQAGDLWLRGYAAGHGFPSWLNEQRWTISAAGEASLVPAPAGPQAPKNGVLPQ